MKTYLSCLLGVLLTGASASAQDLARLYTQPLVPGSQALDRLNLKLSWRTFMPTDGRRDGIFSVQIPDRLRPPGELILIQTRSAFVMGLDGSTGATLWRTRIGTPYALRQRLGYNSKQVFVANGLELYALSRDTGQIQWVLTLPHVASSPPAADEDFVYVALGTGRLYAY